MLTSVTAAVAVAVHLTILFGIKEAWGVSIPAC
jgi:hypothetical protein